MADEVLKADANREDCDGAITDDANEDVRGIRIDPVTKGIVVKLV